MDLGTLPASRVRNVLLGRRRVDGPDAAVGRLLAVQAQEHAFSRWSVAQRTREPDERAVIAAIASGAIVRTHALRPTWHYVRGDDLRWLQALTGERVRKMNAGWYRNHEVDEPFLTATRTTVEAALEGGRAKTRNELRDELAAAGFDVSGQRMTAVMMDLELKTVVCSGPIEGRQHTYALVEERLPTVPAPTEEEATALLVRRYLAGHAPATLKDIRWWSSLTLKQLRRGLEDLGDAVTAEEVDGTEYLWLTDDPPDASEPPAERPFQLLQVFDELFVGYSDTRGLLDRDGEFGAVLPIGYSKMMHVVIEDDRLAGRWRTDRGGRKLEMTVALDRPVSAADLEQLEHVASVYGEFVGADATTLLLGPSTR